MLETEARRYWVLSSTVQREPNPDDAAKVRLWLRKFRHPLIIQKCKALLAKLEAS